MKRLHDLARKPPTSPARDFLARAIWGLIAAGLFFGLPAILDTISN